MPDTPVMGARELVSPSAMADCIVLLVLRVCASLARRLGLKIVSKERWARIAIVPASRPTVSKRLPTSLRRGLTSFPLVDTRGGRQGRLSARHRTPLIDDLFCSLIEVLGQCSGERRLATREASGDDLQCQRLLCALKDGEHTCVDEVTAHGILFGIAHTTV